MTKFREINLHSGTRILLGRDEKSNDELVRKFKGKKNTILHTVAPGSPFCVIEKQILNEDVYSAGVFCAKYSQNWRDYKKDIKVSVFTGKDVSKPKRLKLGTWKVKKSKTITIKKGDILKLEKLE